MLECKHVLPFFHQRAVCRPYICKYGIYGIVTYPRQGNERKLPYFDGMDLRLMLCKFNIAECYLVCFAI